MKQLFFLTSCIFLCLNINAQDGYWSKADVSITSVSLVAHVNPNAPRSIVLPNKNVNLPVPADANITTLPIKEKEIPAMFKCSVTVHNDGKDPANETTVIVVLPAQVTAQLSTLNVNAIMHKYDNTSPFTSYIELKLGDMTAGQNKTVEFVFTRSLGPNKVSAYIYSNTSDTNPLNNYKEAIF